MRRLVTSTLTLVALFLVPTLSGPVSAQETVTVPLPTVVGQAVLSPVDGKTLVTVSATGLGPNTAHGVMIRLGNCGQGEKQDFSDVVFDVLTLQADSAGRASDTATLDVALETLMDGNHKVTIGFFGGRSRGADCGNIPATFQPVALPRTGGPASGMMAVMGMFGLCAIGTGVLLRRGRA